jgi:hypothetical protein
MRSITLFVGALVGTASAQTAGDVKLVNGRTAGGYDGLLQVYYNNAWYSVCDDYFEDNHATLACKQLFNTSWVSWTTDMGHCYTPLTGGIVDLDWYSSFSPPTTFLEAVDGSSSGVFACTHDEDVSIVCGFDGSESATDASLDLSCVPGNCQTGYKQCGDGVMTWCCGEGFPDCGDSYGWCEDKASKKAKQTAWGIFIAIIVLIIVGILICICACCVCCPGCPAYRYGPKDAAAAPVAPAVQMVAQPQVMVPQVVQPQVVMGKEAP